MNKRKWLEISEYICLGLSVLGTIAAAVTQQVVYAAIPLSLSIVLNLANRPRLNNSPSQQQIEQLQTSLQNIKDNFYQVQETMDTSNQRLQQIESWRQQLSQMIDQKIEISLQKISTEINQFNQQFQGINNRLTELDNSLQNLHQTIQQHGEELNNVQGLKSEFSQFYQKIEVINSRFEQIETSFKDWNETSQQQLAELRQNQENKNLEFAQISQQIADFNSRFAQIETSLQQFNQTLKENSQEIEKVKQNQDAENSKFNNLFDSINQSLQALDVLTELDTSFNALLKPLETENQSNFQTSPNYQENLEFNQALPTTSLSDDNLEKLLFVGTLKSHQDKVLSVAFSPNGQILASGSDDKTIKIWDLETQEHRTFKGHGESSWSGGINSVAFSPDGKILASGSDDKTIKLWNIETGKEIITFTGHEEKVYYSNPERFMRKY